MAIGYGIMSALAVVLLACYHVLVKRKEFWLGLLFICVAIVNLGYFMLSLAKSVEFAIFANDFAYLGSVFLSPCMFFTIVKLSGFKVNKKLAIALISLGAVMFLIVATSGWLPIYYKSVWLESVSGATRLRKDYGVLHPLYTVYLIAYCLGMIGAIIYSLKKGQKGSHKFAGLMAAVVCGNVVIWGVEKFIPWEYEMLSVSYILSELVFLFVFWMMQDYVHQSDVQSQIKVVEEKSTVVVVDDATRADKLNFALALLPTSASLTAKEVEILECILEGKKRKDMALDMCLSENTIKSHVKHIYEKYQVSSRDELLSLIYQSEK